ncbi:MAG TPA: hypothetical protein VHX62_06420 [Solirubrobacteraceae bacterium]|jgi:hypothetical protein|nr:hypothetical protein [Solirubrobacteraceae bacterium]
MNDDWRVVITLRENGLAHQLAEQLNADELEHDLQHSFHDRVVVSVDGPTVFCYTGTRDQAQRAQELIRQIAAEHGWPVELSLSHWHPVAEEWQDPDAAEPAGAAATETEREERVADEREDSSDQGYPEFEVRVQFETRHDAGEFAHRLSAEEVPHVHRWSYVLVGANDEDSAGALADRLRAEAPAGSDVTVERNQRSIYEHRPWNPFTLLGGLGG